MNPASTDGFSAKFVYRVIRRRAPTFAVIFAGLFTILAIAQYLFVRHGVYKSSEIQSQRWADQVATEIDYKDKWDLTAHRQSEDVQAPHIYVFTSGGTVLEMTGFIPGLIGRVKLLEDSIFDGPKTVTVAETGEVWREFAIRVKGGIVALGILKPQEVNAPDNVLKSTAREFGSTIEEAAKVRTRQIPGSIDYAVIDDTDNLLFEADWFPLKVEAGSISELASSSGKIQKGGKSYITASKSILDSKGNSVGTIIIPKEITAEEHVIRQHIVFNAVATLASWLAALAVVVLFLAIEDWTKRPQAASLEDALKNGESPLVEFKEGHANVPLQRAIAAFANTDGGTIFLGIKNTGEVVGVDCDTPEKRDDELKRVRNITMQLIRPVISVQVEFISYASMTVVRIFVPRGEQPLYFLDHEIYVREQSSSMKATPEQVERILTRFYK
ncbi:MAG: ATP-binding protein [Verrucomicrobiota bacterium]|jgi:hypothetical protein